MSDKPQQQRPALGFQLPEFLSAKQIFSLKRMNRIIRRLNALSNMKSVSATQCGPLVLGDANSILPVSGSDGSGQSATPTLALPFRLKAIYDEYVTGHLITATFGVGITEDTTTNYYIAKPGKLRTNLASEVKYGDTHSYSYAAGPDSWNLQRTDAWSGGSEDQLVAPPWVQDDEIWAVKAQTVIFDGSDNPIEWIMVGPWRQWAKIA